MSPLKSIASQLPQPSLRVIALTLWIAPVFAVRRYWGALRASGSSRYATHLTIAAGAARYSLKIARYKVQQCGTCNHAYMASHDEAYAGAFRVFMGASKILELLDPAYPSRHDPALHGTEAKIFKEFAGTSDRA